MPSCPRPKWLSWYPTATTAWPPRKRSARPRQGISGRTLSEVGTTKPNDNFGFFLDTFYDRRNAIGFYITPVGGFAKV